jgi:adenosylcobyric acid synthase
MKPMSQTGAQIVVLGKALGMMEAKDYFKDTSRLSKIAETALDRLLATSDVVVMEGAGSPVELNLMARDFVNLTPARHAGAALILVVDINRGGAFAQAKGTLDLLPPEDRARVIGVVVNNFRGDLTLFEDGIPMMEAACEAPVLAVVPHLDHGLDEEDRPIRIPMDEAPLPGILHVGAILTPRVSNTEDIAPLLAESDIQLTWLTRPALVGSQDLLILPGSKGTIADLAYLASSGMAQAIREAHASGVWVLGLCGGYQMLGSRLEDPGGTEGGPAIWEGLGLLPGTTIFGAAKTTELRTYTSHWPEIGHRLSGYEIHHGQTVATGGEPLVQEGGAELGLRGERALGAYLHGLLGCDGWRSAFLNAVRQDRGMPARAAIVNDPMDQRLDRWAAHVRGHLLPGAWERILEATGL